MGILGKIFTSDDEQNNPEAVIASGEKKSVVTHKTAKVSDTKKESISTEKVGIKKDERAYKIISSPMITEKATDLMQLNKYVFAVPLSATKPEIADKIRNVYGVKPVSVNIIKKAGKKVRRGRAFGKRKDFKKAIVTLASNDKIEVYEGV